MNKSVIGVLAPMVAACAFLATNFALANDRTEHEEIAFETSCSCGEAGENNYSAWLASFNGRVFVTTREGVRLAEEPGILRAGSRVVVGDPGRAQVTIGKSCVQNLTANQELEIVLENGRACWQLNDLNFGFTQVQQREGLLVGAAGPIAVGASVGTIVVPTAASAVSISD